MTDSQTRHAFELLIRIIRHSFLYIGRRKSGNSILARREADVLAANRVSGYMHTRHHGRQNRKLGTAVVVLHG
jgi:hypothetical protein